MNNIKDLVEKLKSSISVEGSLLIKSNKFTQEQLDSFFANRGTTHPSHFEHLMKVSKTWSDEEIEEQILAMLNQKEVSEKALQECINTFYKTLPYENFEKEELLFKKFLLDFMGWKKFNTLHPSFWNEFGSAPYSISIDDRNKNLKYWKEHYGACGMQEIFGDKFSKVYHLIYAPKNHFNSFKENWQAEANLRIEAKKVYSSPYNSLDELEENCSVKKIKEEAKKFYLDKTKDFDERIKVFQSHGESEDWIFTPQNSDLKKIFEIYMETSEVNHNENISCISIVESWLSNLQSKRCKIDYSQNQYHPKINSTTRNYTPSKEAIEKLTRYYFEKLFIENVSSFDFDW